jgi:hypothetical protein
MDEYAIFSLSDFAAPTGYQLTIQKGDQGSKALQWVGSLALITNLVGGTTAYGIPITSDPPAIEVVAWTHSGPTAVRAMLGQPAAPRVAGARALRDSILLLRDQSGLTWDQLGRLFGVSRRAVHLWAAGGRMNSYHAERLTRVLAAVQEVKAGTNSQRREVLLAPGPNGRTIYENLLAEIDRVVGVNGPALPPEQLVGALHDEVTLHQQV